MKYVPCLTCAGLKVTLLGSLVPCLGMELPVSNPTCSVTVYERSSKTLEQVTVMVAGDGPHLPMEFVIGPLGLQRKSLPEGKVGICRDDLCIPFSVGEGRDCIRRIADREFVPVVRLVNVLGGTLVWNGAEKELLLDLTGRTPAKPVTGGASMDFTLPDLAGRPVSLSAFRGRKVLLFAWASW